MGNRQSAEETICRKEHMDSPKCCCVTVRTGSLAGALATIVAAVVFAVLVIVYFAHELNDRSTISYLIACVVAITTVQVLSAIAFALGVIRVRHRWMIPLIFCTACVCVASIGADVAITITTFEDFHEARKNNHVPLTEAVLFRIALGVLVIAQVAVLVCFIRCYLFIRKINMLESYTFASVAYDSGQEKKGEKVCE